MHDQGAFRLAVHLFLAGSLMACGSGDGAPSATGSIQGNVDGVAAGAGIAIQLSGPVMRNTTTDQTGTFAFDALPDATYTLTASAPGTSFAPAERTITTRGLAEFTYFRSTPPSSPFTVRITGDATSGVVTGSYDGSNGADPNPDIAVYSPLHDAWTIRAFFDAESHLNLGGLVTFYGTPAVGTYTQDTAGLLNTFLGAICWAGRGDPLGGPIPSWSASSFELRIDSVGAPVPSVVHTASFSDHPVHGSLSATCSPIPSSGAQGTVALEVAF